MANTQTLKLIDDAYKALDVLNNIRQTEYRDKVYKLALAGERQHRRGVVHQYRVSASEAAKMFVVRWIVNYVLEPETIPRIKDVLYLRDDVVLCAALASEYRDDILEVLKGFDLKRIASIDYVELINGRADKPVVAEGPRKGLDARRMD